MPSGNLWRRIPRSTQSSVHYLIPMVWLRSLSEALVCLLVLVVCSTAQDYRSSQSNQQRLTTTQPPPRPTQSLQSIFDTEANLASFYNGVEKFSLEMLTRLAKSEANVAFSPLTTWVLLALMSEGSVGTTLQELRSTMSLPEDTATLHHGFGQIRGDIRRAVDGNTSTLELGAAAFTSPYQSLNPEFEHIAESYYNMTLEKVNFRNQTAAAKKINSWVSDITHGHIPTIVQPADLRDAELVLASALFFRGTWKDAFNVSQTRTEAFFDDEDNKLADVDMMYNVGKFRLSYIESLNCLALELPYTSEKNSMLLLLPRRLTTMAQMLQKLENATQPIISSIMHKLRADANVEEDIHVYLPRFALSSQLKLTNLLKKLTGLSSLNLYVSDLIHKASVTVTEEGTVAAAASAAPLHNYNLPSTFKANKPFLFMIIQKSTNTILFAGKVGNPGA
ncbi:hypothetical protein B566_EDAN004744 [Ephemera danica]|nr:hypothetical protein B566_EDAN004744 [Ephemera danica]